MEIKNAVIHGVRGNSPFWRIFLATIKESHPINRSTQDSKSKNGIGTGHHLIAIKTPPVAVVMRMTAADDA